MEDINALNNKLQSISRALEAAQSLAVQQEEAIRGCMKERERREQQRLGLTEQLSDAMRRRNDIVLKFESEIAITKHLEVDYESAQIMFSHVPALIGKECNDYERFSKKIAAQIRNLHRKLHGNGLWTEQQNDASASLNDKKRLFLDGRRSAKEGSARREESLRGQLEVEETKLAYLEYYASTMPAEPTAPQETASFHIAFPPRQVTPPSASKTPMAVHGSKFTPPYLPSSSTERSTVSTARAATVTSHTLPAVTPACQAKLAAINPFSDWEDRALDSPRPSASVPPSAAAVSAASAPPASGASQVVSLLANYAPCYPRAQHPDDRASEGAGGGDASMDVDYDFTVPTPPLTPPATPRGPHQHHDQHQHFHQRDQGTGLAASGAIELSISTTTTTVTEEPAAGYRSAFLCDTPVGATTPRALTPSASSSYSQYQHHHRGSSQHATAEPALPQSSAVAAAEEESFYSHEAYEEQTRLRQQEVPWFKEFKRRRTSPAGPSPGPPLSSDVRSGLNSYGHSAPNATSRAAEVHPAPVAGRGPYGAVAGAGLRSGTPTPPRQQPPLPVGLPPRHNREGATSAARIFSHGAPESEVIDLYDASDSDEGDQDAAVPAASHSRQIQDLPQTSIGSVAGVAFRSHHGAQSKHQAGINPGQSHSGGGLRDGELRAPAVDGRRGFRTGLDLMQAAKDIQPSSRAQAVTSSFTMIDD